MGCLQFQALWAKGLCVPTTVGGVLEGCGPYSPTTSGMDDPKSHRRLCKIGLQVTDERAMHCGKLAWNLIEGRLKRTALLCQVPYQVEGV